MPVPNIFVGLFSTNFDKIQFYIGVKQTSDLLHIYCIHKRKKKKKKKKKKKQTLSIVQSLRDYTGSEENPDYCFLASVEDMATKEKQ